jgi:hypothetical protein
VCCAPPPLRLPVPHVHGGAPHVRKLEKGGVKLREEQEPARRRGVQGSGCLAWRLARGGPAPRQPALGSAAPPSAACPAPPHRLPLQSKYQSSSGSYSTLGFTPKRGSSTRWSRLLMAQYTGLVMPRWSSGIMRSSHVTRLRGPDGPTCWRGRRPCARVAAVPWGPRLLFRGHGHQRQPAPPRTDLRGSSPRDQSAHGEGFTQLRTCGGFFAAAAINTNGSPPP